MREIDYFDLLEKLVDKPGLNRRPLAGDWELTYRCNLSCRHCYIYQDNDKEELSYAEVTSIIDQLYQEGCLHLIFTGGEPFLRQDFLDIYAYAKNRGFLVTILTNGTLLDKDALDYLKRNPPFMIEITLHSLDQETFENITHTPDSFEKCMQAIKMIRERRLPLTLKTLGMSLNKNHILQVKDFVQGLEGVKFKFDAFILPKRNGSHEPCQLRLLPEEIVELVFLDEEMSQQLLNCKNVKETFERNKSFFSCSAGLTSFHINPYGQLQLCLEMREPFFDLRKGSFQKGFYEFLYQVRLQDYQPESPCKDCCAYYICGHCPARGLAENGKMDEPVEYLCQLAKKISFFLDKKDSELTVVKAD
jgi:radical SAM protein with 4Fe4S-binding SPASM domain